MLAVVWELDEAHHTGARLASICGCYLSACAAATTTTHITHSPPSTSRFVVWVNHRVDKQVLKPQVDGCGDAGAEPCHILLHMFCCGLPVCVWPVDEPAGDPVAVVLVLPGHGVAGELPVVVEEG